MTAFAWVLIGVPAVLLSYAYVGYPALLKLIGAFRPPPREFGDPEPWPMISVTIPAYNEAGSIRSTIESLLALPYPEERRQILIISDASTDGTDDIVLEYRHRGVELLRLSNRGGKTAAENAAVARLRGEIIVNTDATVRIVSGSLKALVRVFQDPTVGVASGRDLSVGDVTHEGNRAESGYVGYEMWVRSLETRMGSIVGASGCFYGIRKSLQDTLFPEALSRDFACALIAWEHGFRAVSVNQAVCFVPRTRSLRAEYGRKVRTMARGLDTLWYKRNLMNPAQYGIRAWMLISHKLLRWLAVLTLPAAVVGLAILAPESVAGALGLAMAAVLAVCGVVAFRWPEGRRVPAPLATAGFLTLAFAASLEAWAKALRRERNPIWEPTRRPGPG